MAYVIDLNEEGGHWLSKYKPPEPVKKKTKKKATKRASVKKPRTSKRKGRK